MGGTGNFFARTGNFFDVTGNFNSLSGFMETIHEAAMRGSVVGQTEQRVGRNKHCAI
jgi:hypothetical protein